MNNIRKIFTVLMCLALAAASGCSQSAGSTGSSQAGSSAATQSAAASSKYTREEVTAHLYEKDKTAKVSILKTANLPDCPWINVMDFLKYTFNDKVEFDISKAGNVFTITKKNNGVTMEAVNKTMVVDADKDTVTFPEQEMFIIGEDAYKDPGSTADNSYVKELQPEYAPGTEVKSAVYDLAKYGLDVVTEGDDIFLPISTISSIFTFNYNTAEYVGGDVYFTHMGEETGADKNNPYVNKTTLYDNITRTKAEIDFAYKELCFVMDEMYGYPGNNKYSGQLKEKGFDKTLEDNAELTHLKKDYIMSDNLVDYYRGLNFLTAMMDDKGHTSFALLSSTVSNPIYEKTKLITEWSDESKIKFPEDAAKYNAPLMESGQAKGEIMQARAAAYTGNSHVIKDTSVFTYVQNGTKAYFAFDKCKYDVLPELKEALEHASSHGVKDFYFDLSCNGGGDERVVAYIMALIAGDETFYYKNAKTGNKVIQKSKIDRNLDGVFDAKDDEYKFGFNYGIITSKFSFSCGNLLPCLARGAGIPIYGEKSGGGTCFAVLSNHADSMSFMISSQNTFALADDWSDVEGGAPVKEEWVKKSADGKADYSNFYGFLK
ncbi:MAG: hypothetical protein IK152_04795 [Lachnospiraceae bacterium]|nr:hypothetical protein [Lachnospiraceae bacterium]